MKKITILLLITTLLFAGCSSTEGNKEVNNDFKEKSDMESAKLIVSNVEDSINQDNNKILSDLPKAQVNNKTFCVILDTYNSKNSPKKEWQEDAWKETESIDGFETGDLVVKVYYDNSDFGTKLLMSEISTTIPFENLDLGRIDNNSSQKSTSKNTIDKNYKSISEVDGYDWSNMSFSEKNEFIQRMINNIEDDFIVKVNSDWFVEAINNYYDSTNKEDKVNRIFSLVGTMGGAIEER